MKSLLKNFCACFLVLTIFSFLSEKTFAQVRNTITLKASKSYNPDTYSDFDSTLLMPVKFAIPEYLSVTGGSTGNGLAMLKLYNASTGDSTTIIYKGSEHADSTLAPGQLKKGKKYYFQSSSNGMKAGDLSSSTNRVYLRVGNGNSLAGSTAIAQSVNIVMQGNCNGYHIYSSQGGEDMVVANGDILVCPNQPFTLTAIGVPSNLIVTWEQLWDGGDPNNGGAGQSQPCGGGNGQQFTTRFCTCPSPNYIDCDNGMIVTIFDPTNGSNAYCKVYGGIDITTNIVTASGSTTICQGSSANLSASGSPIGAYTWTDPSGAIKGTTAKITVNPTQTTTYTVKSGCGTDQVTVYVNPATVNATSATICSGGTTSVSLTSPTVGATFTWPAPTVTGGITGSSSGSGTPIAQTLTNQGASAGIVTYAVSATAGGCTGTAQNIVVTVNPVPVITAPPTAICYGQTETLTASAGSAWQWYLGGIAISGATNSTYDIPTTLSVGNYDYTVDVTSAAARCTSNTVSISINPASCCAPASATIMAPGDLGTAGIVTDIDASTFLGGTVVFSGTYHVLGSLRFKNGTFYLSPGTVFNIDQTNDWDGLVANGAHIYVLDATLHIGGATLQSDPSLPLSVNTTWGGLIVQRSTIHTESCGQRAVIRNANVGIVIPYDPGVQDNTSHYFINNTDFINNRWLGLWDIYKSTPILTGEGITGCTLKSPYWYTDWYTAIYLAGPDPRVTGTLPVRNNYFESLYGTGILSDYDFALLEDNKFKQVVEGIEINSVHTPYQHLISKNNIELDNFAYAIGILDRGNGEISDNMIIGTGLPGQSGIYIRGTFNASNTTIKNNIMNKTNVGVSINIPPYYPPLPISARCNTIDNSGLGGTNYGIYVQPNAFLNPLGSSTNPNGNAFIGFNGTTNFPMEYDGSGIVGPGGFQYFKSTSPLENIKVTQSGTSILNADVLVANAPGCSSAPGAPGVGFRIAASSPLSAQDSVNAAMDSLRFQLGSFNKMKGWQGEIISYFEKTNDLDGLYSYCDTLEGCNLEAYNTFMLYLMNKYDIMNECSKSHICASEVLNANPNDAEIQARTTYFNYECRQRHSGQRSFILPFMPMNPQDSTDLTQVANSGTSLSQAAWRQLRRHNPNALYTQNTYTPNYPGCGPDCKKKKNEFLKNGWEKQTGLKADKKGGQLSQNIPNPSDNETVIPYLIPQDSFTSAYITIQSVMNGSEVKRIELPQTGYGAVTVNLENLSSGVYIYTLVVDGTKQDIKRMVVVK
jgi:hypothetical protein